MSKHSQRRTSTTLVISGLLACGLLLVASAAWAAKPGGGGGGTPAGWIHYSMYTVNQIARMRADGSTKEPTTWLLPSNQTHENVNNEPIRWFLDVQLATHESWRFPDACGRDLEPYEIVLRDGQGTTLWLTGDPAVEFRQLGDGLRAAWAPDDSFVSFVGIRRTAAEAGAGNFVDFRGEEWLLDVQFFRVWIDWSVTPADPDVDVLEPELLNLDWPFLLDGCWPDPDGAFHSWSPDGNSLALNQITTKTVHVADVSTGTVSLLAAAPASSPAWSPNGQRIAYDTGFSGWDSLDGNDGIYTVNPNGSGLLHVTNPSGNVWHVTPKWSPDSAHLTFVRAWLASPARTRYGNSDIYRVPAVGGSQVNLTRDLPDDLVLKLLGWVE